MSKLERMIRTYYCRVVFTKDSLHFGGWSLLFLALLVTAVFRFSFSDRFEFWFFIISVVGCIILSALNYIGESLLEKSSGFNWLIIPWISGIFATIVAWVLMLINPHQHFERTYLSQQFLIYFPIIFPIFTLILQYSLNDVLTEKEPKKDILLLIPGYTIGLLGIAFGAVFVLAESFEINGYRTLDFFIAIMLGMANLAVPTLFTATSEYWHPELKQARYSEAIGTLKKTKKSKKTGKKKKRMKLKK